MLKVVRDTVPIKLLLYSASGGDRAGKLRALAVTSAKRVGALPDIPTVSEFIPGYEVSAWDGLVAPKGTPAEFVYKLNVATNAALADPKLRARVDEPGLGATSGSIAESASS